MLRSESSGSMCAKLRTVAVSSNRDHALQSLYYCLFAPRIHIVVLCTRPVHGESHIQCNATREVATTSPTFYNELYRSHILFVKAEPGTTFTSWSQHHFVVIGKPKGHVRKASHCGNKQQKRSCAAITLLLFVCTTYTYCCSSRTSRSWWITHSTQRHQRGCNNSRAVEKLWPENNKITNWFPN